MQNGKGRRKPRALLRTCTLKSYSSSGEKCQVDKSLYLEFLEEMKIGDKPSTIVLP